jgi:hypothetical protein
MAEKKKATTKKEDKPRTLGTKEVAAKLGISATTFRRVLRAAGKNTEGEYSRYTWKPEDVQGDKLDKLKKLVEEHTNSKEKKGKKKATGKKKTKGAKANKKKGADDTEDIDEEVSGEEEEEEELV